MQDEERLDTESTSELYFIGRILRNPSLEKINSRGKFQNWSLAKVNPREKCSEFVLLVYLYFVSCWQITKINT